MTFRKSIRNMALSLLFGAVLVSCGTSNSRDEHPKIYKFPTTSNTQYYCDQSRQMLVSFGVNSQSANVLYSGQLWLLERVDDKQDVYTDGRRTLLKDGKFYALESDGVPFLTGCTSERSS